MLKLCIDKNDNIIFLKYQDEWKIIKEIERFIRFLNMNGNIFSAEVLMLRTSFGLIVYTLLGKGGFREEGEENG